MPGVDARTSAVRITEIYLSIQGESSRAGLPCTFIRTTGCDLRCSWCDSEYSFTGGVTMSVDEVFERVERLGCGLVELTGGEPLLQKDIGELATRLCDAGYTVLLETGGHRDVSVMDPRVILIVDIKCPDSGESERNLWSNIERLRPTDEVKFVLASARDYEWARDVITRYRLSERTSVLLSTAYGLLQPATVVEWLLRDRLDVRFQLQMHKFIWSAAARGV